MSNARLADLALKASLSKARLLATNARLGHTRASALLAAPERELLRFACGDFYRGTVTLRVAAAAARTNFLNSLA